MPTHTHEFQSRIMDANRTSVSLAYPLPQKHGLISNGRGSKQIRDSIGPEKATCERYAVVKARFIPVLSLPATAVQETKSGRTDPIQRGCTVAKASKAFFFEKKKQKTFAAPHWQRTCSRGSTCPLHKSRWHLAESKRPRPGTTEKRLFPTPAAPVTTNEHARRKCGEAKVFCFFFSKKKAFLTPATRHASHSQPIATC